MHAHAASSVRFECEAEGIPKPNISWSLNGRKLTNSGYINVGDGFLQVQDLVTSDTGVYQCFAKGNSGEFQASAQLFVYRAGKDQVIGIDHRSAWMLIIFKFSLGQQNDFNHFR